MRSNLSKKKNWWCVTRRDLEWGIFSGQSCGVEWFYAGLWSKEGSSGSPHCSTVSLRHIEDLAGPQISFGHTVRTTHFNFDMCKSGDVCIFVLFSEKVLSKGKVEKKHTHRPTHTHADFQQMGPEREKEKHVTGDASVRIESNLIRRCEHIRTETKTTNISFIDSLHSSLTAAAARASNLSAVFASSFFFLPHPIPIIRFDGIECSVYLRYTEWFRTRSNVAQQKSHLCVRARVYACDAIRAISRSCFETFLSLDNDDEKKTPPIRCCT